MEHRKNVVEGGFQKWLRQRAAAENGETVSDDESPDTDASESQDVDSGTQETENSNQEQPNSEEEANQNDPSEAVDSDFEPDE